MTRARALLAWAKREGIDPTEIDMERARLLGAPLEEEEDVETFESERLPTLLPGRRFAPRFGNAGLMATRYVGVDTETLLGYARVVVMADHEGRLRELTLRREQVGDETCLARALRFLSGDEAFSSAVCMAWNMHFDAEAILKYLPKERLYEVARFGETDVSLVDEHGSSRWRLEYAPDRVLRVNRLRQDGVPHGSRYLRLFDLAQFYDHVPQSVAAEANGIPLFGRDLDAARMNEDPAYWQEHEEQILTRCRSDALACARLAKTQGDLVQSTLGVSFRGPYSVAATSRRAFVRYGAPCPPPPMAHMRMAYEAFYGGRAETRLRGDLGVCTVKDRPAAYARELVGLPSTMGEWVYRRSPTRESLDAAPYAFAECLVDVTVQPDAWGPLPVRYGRDELRFPKGRLHGTWPWPEVQAAEDLGLAKVRRIHAGVYLVPSHDAPQRPFAYVERFIAMKAEAEREAALIEGHARDRKLWEARTYKLAYCGTYGKQVETQDVLQPDPKGEIEQAGRRWRKAKKVGGYFNSPLGAYVTSRNRVRMLRELVRLEDDAVCVLVDAVAQRGRACSTSEWIVKRDACGPMRLVRSGVYCISGGRARRQGFRANANGGGFDLFQSGPYVSEGRRAYRLREAVRDGREADICRFLPRRDELSPHPDDRRWWKETKSFDALFSDEYIGLVLDRRAA